MTAQTELLNEDAAGSLIQSVNDPVVRELLRLAFGRLRLHFIQPDPDSCAPEADFDAHFYCIILEGVFSNKDALRKLLDGGTLAAVTGWDF